jgi:hypothetical protein
MIVTVEGAAVTVESAAGVEDSGLAWAKAACGKAAAAASARNNARAGRRTRERGRFASIMIDMRCSLKMHAEILTRAAHQSHDRSLDAKRRVIGYDIDATEHIRMSTYFFSPPRALKMSGSAFIAV